ncbi:hypothetical protein [Salinivibrio sp. ML198]|uniref:hypothetical protein n=1 Tax=Salinivibrio sp. ML198 TaxID=1909458 RepID=UPI0018E3A2D7|nr:hypothetical protein [Salinivibrio sp. ML198]
MFSRVQPSLLTPRLDADFYKVEFISNEAHLKEFGIKRLAQLIDVKASGYGVLPSSNEYCEGGVPLIRGGDLSFGEVVSPSVFAPLSYKDGKGTAKTGDVLILIKGACIDGPEGVARVKQDNNGHLFNGSCFRLAFTDREIDGPFFIAYSQSKFFLRQKKRQVANTGISYNDEDSIHGYLIPDLKNGVKKYIGDKVRQAEQLRAWAKYVQQQAAVLLPAYINEIQRHEAKSYRAKDIIPERLDSLFYHPDYIALEGKMKAKGCKRLGLITKQIKDSWDKKKAEVFEYYEIGGLDITTGQVSSTKTHTVGAPSRAKTKIQQGDVLVSTVRPNRKNVGFIVDSVTDSEMVATSGFSVLRFSSLAQAAFYHAWLRTDDATAQLMRWNSGSAYPAIDDDVPLNIIIPDFEQTFVDSWGQKLLDAQFAYVYARRLTEAAKTLVESLIEGQLTEQQLIQAQQSLDDGDNSLDQAILSKLSNEGYAIEEATPLFSDIDELYRLLESATQAEAEE